MKLKPCPFCGSEMQLNNVVAFNERPEYWIQHINVFDIPDCPLKFFIFTVDSQNYSELIKQTMIELWNKRANVT